MANINEILVESIAVAAPPPLITVSEWAERFRYLSPEASAEPGRWRNERAPHLVKPMDALSPHDPCQEVVCKFSSQTGKTEIMLNFIGYIMDVDPGPTLAIQPNTKPMGEAFSKDRIAPMLRDTPVLAEKFGTQRGKSRNSGESTIMHKAFTGGHLTIGGANSPAGLASRPIRFVLFDEIDRFETTKEGDAISLAVKRAKTFHNRKILKVSSPTYDDVGVDLAYSQCDQQFELRLKCPSCEESQFPALKHFEWPENEIDKAVYICEHCGEAHGMKEEGKIKSLSAWFQTKNDGDMSKGFWANQWASPFATWRETIDEFVKAKKTPSKLQTVINTAFAETWKEHAEQADPDSLITFAESYDRDSLPDDILMQTVGADVQKDRVEVQRVGWAYGGIPFIIAHDVFYGNPMESEVWAEVDQFLKKSLGGQGVAQAFIDSRYLTQYVYKFTKPRHGRRVFPINGESGLKEIVSKPKQTGAQRAMLVKVGIDGIKRTLLTMLKSPGDMIHFSSELDEEFYKQLTAEKMVIKKVKGFDRIEFVKTRDRNEALDCFVYAYAAMIGLNPDWEAIKAGIERRQITDDTEDDSEIAEETPEVRRRPLRKQRKKSGFVKRY